MKLSSLDTLSCIIHSTLKSIPSSGIVDNIRRVAQFSGSNIDWLSPSFSHHDRRIHSQVVEEDKTVCGKESSVNVVKFTDVDSRKERYP